MLSAETTLQHLDPLAKALARKRQADAPGTAKGTAVAVGHGWRVVDVVCTSGPRDRSFEEQHGSASISLVLSGTFVYRSDHGSWLMSPGAMLLGNADHAFECSHEEGEGDRCLSFQFDAELLDRIARDAGSRARFDCDRLPPIRALAPIGARAALALAGRGSFEEVALELAGAVLRTADRSPREKSVSSMDPVRIAPVLRYLESECTAPQTLAELARVAGMSPYHFLRTFRRATGTTPHQWVLRARLREAAELLAGTPQPVTEIALDVGFEDLSNFIRTFRSEFGMSPREYRKRS